MAKKKLTRERLRRIIKEEKAKLENGSDNKTLRDVIREEIRRMDENASMYTPQELINLLDDMPSMQSYRLPDAKYDDIYYSMPVSVLNSQLGLNRSDLEAIGKKGRREYDGDIGFQDGNRVNIYGAAP